MALEAASGDRTEAEVRARLERNDVEPDLIDGPLAVMADADQLTQVVANLLAAPARIDVRPDRIDLKLAPAANRTSRMSTPKRALKRSMNWLVSAISGSMISTCRPRRSASCTCRAPTSTTSRRCCSAATARSHCATSWQPAAVAILFVGGQMLMFLALEKGDVASAVSYAERAVEKSPTDAAPLRSRLKRQHLSMSRHP